MKRHSIRNLPLVVAGALLISSLSSDGQSTAATPAPRTVPPPVASLPPLPTPPLRPVLKPLARRDIAEIQRLTPRIEVWRPNSNNPQLPVRRSERGKTDPAFVNGNQPVTVRLQFDPRSAGEQVRVIAARGISADPSEQVLTVSSAGDCTFPAQLLEGSSRGHFLVYCRSVRTVVSLTRAPLAVVEAGEAQGGNRP